MQNLIEGLLKHFDSGTLTRRELMQGLALLAAGIRSGGTSGRLTA